MCFRAMFCCAQDNTWYGAEAVLTSENKWCMQALGGICMECGCGVDALAWSENKKREQILEDVQTDRALKAKVILMHSIQRGEIPRGFEASVVKTVHAVGQNNTAMVAAVNQRHFAQHKFLKYDPGDFPTGNRIECKTFDILDGDMNVESCVAMKLGEDMPDDLAWQQVEVYHKTETQLVEYQLTPKTHLRSEQALGVFKLASRAVAKDRGVPITLPNMYTALSLSQWKRLATDHDKGKVQADKDKEDLANTLGTRPARSALVSSGGFSAPLSLAAASAPTPTAKAWGSRSGRRAGTQAPRWAGSLDITNSGAAQAEPRSRSPRIKSEHRPSPPAASSSARRAVKAEALTPTKSDFEMKLGDSDSDGPAAGRGGKIGAGVRGIPRIAKDWTVADALLCPDGGNLGRSTEPAMSSVVFLRCC